MQLIKRKYISLFKISMQESLAYRFNYFMGILSSFIYILTMYYVWRGIFSGRDILNGYTWSQMKTYLFASFIINTFISFNTGSKVTRRIMDGSVAMDLLKPYSFQKSQLAQVTGACVTEAGASILLSGIFVAIFGGVDFPGLVYFFLFLVSLIASILIKFCIVYLFGLICFWTTGSLGVVWARIAITDLFSGALVPITFFPVWLLNITKVLPFQGIVYIPASIFIGREQSIQSILTLIAGQFIWVLVLWLLGNLMWKWAIRQITIHGG